MDFKKYCLTSIIIFTTQFSVACSISDSDSVLSTFPEFKKVLNDLNSLKAKNEMLEKTIEMLEKNQRDHGSDLIMLKSNNIAFSAQLHTNLNLKNGNPVIYGTEVTDTNSAYNPRTGKFKAPKTGIYVFTFTVVVEDNIGVELVIDGTKKAHLFVNAGPKYDYASSAQTVVLRVNRNQDVWIRKYIGRERIGGAYNSFSGWILSSYE